MGSGLWVRLDASYYLDAAILEAGEAAEVLYLRALGLAKTVLTDGLLTRPQLATLGLDNLDARASRLVEVGLWLPVKTGWQIRSWLRWNSSAKRVEEIREKRKRSGRLGGRPKQNAKHGDKQIANQTANQIALTVSNPEAEVELEPEEVPPSGGGKPPSAHQAWMSRAVPAWKDLCPEDDDPGGFLANARKQYGPNPVQLAIEHMWVVGWNPDGNVKTAAEKVKAFRSYLSKAAQGIRGDAAKEGKG